GRDGSELASGSLTCPACNIACRGPQWIECDGVPDVLFAFLDWNYGAPLPGHVCVACSRVWLRLPSDDFEARRELAKRFSDDGLSGRCGQCRLRITRLYVPPSGLVGLYDPSLSTNSTNAGDADALSEWAKTRVAELLLEICDNCGEATTRVARTGTRSIT